jgi:hypothetical protein
MERVLAYLPACKVQRQFVIGVRRPAPARLNRRLGNRVSLEVEPKVFLAEVLRSGVRSVNADFVVRSGSYCDLL